VNPFALASLYTAIWWGAAMAPITTTPRCRDGNSLDSVRDRWTEEDDQNLAGMADSGSDIWAMAEEMGRTERAVRARLKIVRPAWRMQYTPTET